MLRIVAHIFIGNTFFSSGHEVCITYVLFYLLRQVSVGYFMADLGMIFWFFPALGGYEYVRIMSFDEHNLFS